jgi:hypothetical protein
MTWELVGNIKGPKGDPGAGTGQILHQVSPMATWTFSHSLGRVPAVAIYLVDELVLAPVEATTTTVIVQFPSPQVGYLILT